MRESTEKNKYETAREDISGGEEGLKQKKVFIEIGTNQLPVPWFGKRKFGEDEIYVGIEKARDDIYTARENVRDVVEKDQNIHFIQAYAEKLPLQDASADEIFLGNVLGDPSISSEKKDAFIEESKRALKKGGIIIIKETNTPPTLKWINDFLKKHGLRVEQGATPESPEWKDLVLPYERTVRVADPDSFIVFVEPIVFEESMAKMPVL